MRNRWLNVLDAEYTRTVQNKHAVRANHLIAVPMKIDWTPIREILESNQRFVLSSHVRPDADAIGSELGMTAILEAMGKSVCIVNPSALPANLKFLDTAGKIKKIGEDISISEAADTDVHIVLDTSAWAQLLDIGKVLKKSKAKTKIVIDHHMSSDDLDAIEFKDTNCEATGSLVFELVEFLGIEIDADCSAALFSAIATDTGWFRFPSTKSSTMHTIGKLIDLGAQPNLIYQQLYEQSSLARLRLQGRVLGRMETDCDGRLAYICVKQDDFTQTGAVQADTEDLVNECLKITGTEGAFIAIEQRNNSVKASFRSRTDLNVAAVAEKFGGGGHKQAAGAVLPGPLADALATILTTMRAAMNGKSPDTAAHPQD